LDKSTDSEDLFVKNELGEVLPISSNEEDFCLHCGVQITADNDSGWEQFRDDGVTTQKVCKKCDSEPHNNKKTNKNET